ncbi:3-hydroxy-5-phosphonooxypentane-2,4-dione thiolase [Aureibacter tunicatorum]|uniref:Autoinducer-2 (AI-2) aldolase n=1 Tax=Aureibacter tunicatorum TaxID=866807 RepID=A0AAE4BVJ7_9BACT|nr:3-hydroxy-5-phosphonooxypentane-2,4-dione thiolase [Aureibacter tunicatorum]MDR6241783.1 putative autoinducer-2 (AI-2) aldolase [Aureibacter tunicatorum]BDD07425.1 3-hydroxy-5-phosphonooxypentane-2,4-dione thiolase [Aureibacter tunicatorum]
MADAEGIIESKEKDFGIGVPVETEGFYLKGMSHMDWGIKDRLRRMFNPKSGRTVMLAFDHGYIMGPTSGLERLDLNIVPLIPYADSLMCTKAALRNVVPPTSNKPICLRSSAGTTILNELNDEVVIDPEEAIRVNASTMAVMVSVGGQYEAKTIANLVKTADAGYRYGIPTMGVTAVGKELARDARYLSMASRVCAENGATIVKTYYCNEHFERVVNSCPVPIVVAGGKKLAEYDALTLCYKAISGGAAGLDMGRNVFQSESPKAMIQAINGVVHDNLNPDEAFELYNDVKSDLELK